MRLKPAGIYHHPARGLVSLLILVCILQMGYICYSSSLACSLSESRVAFLPRGPSVAKDSNAYHYRIFVFTYSRPEGLRMTLSSLLGADYSKASSGMVDLEVFVDYRRDETPQGREAQLHILQMLRNVSWPYGRYKIHQRLQNMGLRYSIMEAWQPTSDKEIGAFFEDDVMVSPFWFSWTSDAVAQYAPIVDGNVTMVDPHFIGFSLFRPIFDQLSSKNIPTQDTYAPFLLQQPCSWGSVYLPIPWRKFRAFFDQHKNHDLVVKLGKGRRQPTSNYWDYATSWKKYLIYYMYKNGLYMMYPNFPNKLVLSTSRMLPGEHPTPSKSLFVLPLLEEQHLQDESVLEAMWLFPNLKAMTVYDVMFNKVASTESLKGANNAL